MIKDKVIALQLFQLTLLVCLNSVNIPAKRGEHYLCSHLIKELPSRFLSSSMLVFDSRDLQGNVWLPYNTAMLAAFTILHCKTNGKTTVDWSDTLSKLKIYSKLAYIYALEVMLLYLRKTCTT